jgi:hypothetical protein
LGHLAIFLVRQQLLTFHPELRFDYFKGPDQSKKIEVSKKSFVVNIGGGDGKMRILKFSFLVNLGNYKV